MNRPPPKTLALSVLPALLGSCVQEPPVTPVADVQQLMISVLEPAAEVYWDAVGWILDENGTHHFRPSTDEEWTVVRNAGFVMAESGNLLMMEGRAKDAGPWMAMSRAMVEVGQRAIEAADTHDPQAVFDMGAEVYFVCTACHATYATETLRPNQTSDSVTSAAGEEREAAGVPAGPDLRATERRGDGRE